VGGAGPGAVIFRHRRRILWGAAVLVVLAAVFALPVFGELGSDDDFDDPSSEAVQARKAVTEANAASSTRGHRAPKV